ncbi:hypothetical protein Lepto7375DRAFT_0902 [Leptolyngbya sp. PCC 7375]|nr:hypothetical protein Lepto7375DRAFT_0902 [Leptolyngbya sp. PCC 7375]
MRQWTNYLTLAPVRLVQNVLGGGDVQRDRIAIATLELETANLIRRREAVAEEITHEVVDLVLDYEQMIRKGKLLAAQLETQQQRQAVQETKYRTGQSSTDAMLRVWQRTGDLQARCEENRADSLQVIRELQVLTEDEREFHGVAVNAGACVAWRFYTPGPTTTTEADR